MWVRPPPNACIATIAQLVEHLTCNEVVVGSIPTCGSDYASIAQLAEHVTLNHQVLGSIPSGCITLTGELMFSYIVLAIACIGMMIFAIGAVYLSDEEKSYRYDIQLTDEHEI